MWEMIQAFLFGLVEGVTEWLPVSSTGHLILLERLIPWQVSASFWEMFEVVIQLGAILAVVVLYWKQLWPFGKRNNPTPLQSSGAGAWLKKDVLQMWGKVIVACLPAAVVGILLDDVFTALFYNEWVIAAMLILFGVAFLVIENRKKGTAAKYNSIAELSYRTVLWIGVFQLIAAVFPGTSRSGATIVGALLLGVSRAAAAEFTFFLAVPVMFGASLLKLVKFGFDFTSAELVFLLIGMVTAFVVSLLVIRFLMQYIKKHDFTVFGWYRIGLGLLVLLYFGVIAR